MVSQYSLPIRLAYLTDDFSKLISADFKCSLGCGRFFVGWRDTAYVRNQLKVSLAVFFLQKVTEAFQPKHFQAIYSRPITIPLIYASCAKYVIKVWSTCYVLQIESLFYTGLGIRSHVKGIDQSSGTYQTWKIRKTGK